MDQIDSLASRAATPPEGRLFYVVGASDAGKDQLLSYARGHLGDSRPVVFAHRYVARQEASAENQIGLSAAEFAMRKRHGLFAMSWEGKGRHYGIGTEINYWLAMGLSVVVKGSRAYLGQALKAYPDMTVIWVTAEGDAPATRPSRRAREFRMGRAPHEPFMAPVALGLRIVHIRNSGTLKLAGDKLLSVLAGRAD
ncbi:MAG TPA: phosphonate metabolism protein/1,5-bisphosphokinase (PRPP-forming) PhnN [Burkholderiales bacterium]|nr:phosphonate metabolism protein/1,5-bisphosphokinase (PRPP-forming) PhnN [Burkholderiales bacterium]